MNRCVVSCVFYVMCSDVLIMRMWCVLFVTHSVSRATAVIPNCYLIHLLFKVLPSVIFLHQKSKIKSDLFSLHVHSLFTVWTDQCCCTCMHACIDAQCESKDQKTQSSDYVANSKWVYIMVVCDHAQLYTSHSVLYYYHALWHNSAWLHVKSKAAEELCT